MALIKCPECEREISDKAVSCPNCGCPIEGQINIAKVPIVESQSIIASKPTKSATYTAPNYENNYNVHSTQRPKNKSGCLIAILIVFGIMIVLGVMVVFGVIASIASDPGKVIIETTATDSAKEGKEEATIASTEEPTLEPTEIPQIESMDKFIKTCKKYKYKDLLRNPDDYIGKRIKIKAKIYQVMDGGWFDDGIYYRCYTDNDGYDVYFDDEYYIADARTDKDAKLLNDDIITIYGEYIGSESLTRALTGTQDEIPKINMFYVKLHEEKESE